MRLLFLAACLSVTLVMAGCWTVAPKPVTDHVPSFDGTNQNSGFIGYAPDGRGIITPHKREVYNRLIARYGNRFPVPLTPDAGLEFTSTNTVLINQENLVDLGEMQAWWIRDNRPPL